MERMAVVKGMDDRGSRSIRALEVLEALTEAERPLTVAEIVAATGLPKATVHRICGLLEKEGFLAPNIGGKGLTAGFRTRNLALGILASGADYDYRHRVLADLSQDIGETCNLNVPLGGKMQYVDRVETEWPLRTQLPIGSRVPLHCTASGKLYLSSLPAARRRRLIGALEFERHTPHTIADPEALLADLERIRHEGIGTDDEEFVTGMVAVAVPVTDAKGRLAATLACHAPSTRMTMAIARSYVPRMRRAAAKISAGGEADLSIAGE